MKTCCKDKHTRGPVVLGLWWWLVGWLSSGVENWHTCAGGVGGGGCESSLPIHFAFPIGWLHRYDINMSIGKVVKIDRHCR